MSAERYENEPFVRAWVSEPVWLPDIDVSAVDALVAETPQRRGRLPLPAWPSGGGLARAAGLAASVALMVATGGFVLHSMLPGPGDDAAVVAPAESAVGRTSEPQAEPTPLTLQGADEAGPTLGPWLTDDEYAELMVEGPPIVLIDGSARFEAERIRIDGRTAEIPLEVVVGDVPLEPGSVKVFNELGPQRKGRPEPASRELLITWEEGDARPRLRFTFASSDDHWWVSKLVVDGLDGQRSVYEGPLFKTRRPGFFSGDVQLRSRPRADGTRSTLGIDDLLLTPFMYGRQPPQDCQLPKGWDPDRGLLEEGQPVSATSLVGLTAAEAHATLEEHGLCHDFRIGYVQKEIRDEEGGIVGFNETWCVPPPDGVVVSLMETAGPNRVRVYLRADGVWQQRYEPILGFGCS